MAFTETLAALPHTATKQQAVGFHAPIFRAMVHVTYVLACEANPNMKLTDEEVLAEIGHARLHWEAVRLPAGVFSKEMTERVVVFAMALKDVENEYTTWDDHTKVRNIKQLSDRAIGLGVLLDKEVLGIADADPGMEM